MEGEQLTTAEVALVAHIDADDVVRALNNNDELILAFIMEMLQLAGSSDLNARVVERITSEDA